MKYYSLKEIKKKKAQYNVIFGERSNGKTFAILAEILQRFVDTGEQGALIRRMQEDFRGANSAKTSFDGINKSGLVSKLTHGNYDRVIYDAGAFFLARPDEENEGKIIKHNIPVVIAFWLTGAEHIKSSNHDNITTIFFDEMLARRGYLPDEWGLFTSVVSTIVRSRNNVTIYMAGNTVTKYCPYFAEMGLHKAKTMPEGHIDVYEYGDSGLRVAVERTAHDPAGKASDVYFAFNNSPRLAMITQGGWEMELYPHCPTKFLPKHVRFSFFVIFDGETLQGDVVNVDGKKFLFIHRKTTPIKDQKRDIVYQQDIDPRPNYRRKLSRDRSEIGRKLYDFFLSEKVFYQDNEVGEIVRNYLIWSDSDK